MLARMALPYTVPSLDAIPEPQRALYKPTGDGKFVIDVDGVAPAADLAAAAVKLAEFRENNSKLLKALGAAGIEDGLARAAAIAGIDAARLAKLKDVDPDEYARLKASAAKLTEKGLGDPESADAKLKALVEQQLEPVRKQLEAEQKARAEAQAKASDALFVGTVGEEFVRAGGQPGAREFMAMEARKVFRVEGDKVVANEGHYSAVKAGEPLTLSEWLAAQAKANPWAFKESTGGGATGGRQAPPMSSTPRAFRLAGGGELNAQGIVPLN